MTGATRKLALSVFCLAALHELCLWALCESQLPSVLFAPGSHSPVLAAAAAVAFICLRLCVYLVAPWVLATWAADRAVNALSATAALRFSAAARRKVSGGA